MQKTNLIVIALSSILMFSCSGKKNTETADATIFPEIKSETKPWTRWWWMGSAVDSANIKQNLIDLQKVGIGGVEIAPIYGVKGEEENFINYLSPKWMHMLSYTTKVADSLGMQVDLTLGTGWPYGGPQVTREYAATKLITQKYEVKKGETFSKEIRVENPRERQPATLNYVLAYGESGAYLDLTSEMKGNKIVWEAKDDNYTIIAVFTGKTGQQVKRAAPGAKGFTLDHYSEEALNTYVKPFGEAFIGFSGKIRSIFNDSYEVYGTDFTPNFFEAFQHYRGYDLKPFLPLLLSEEDTDEGNRLKSDYRETLSDLLLYKFDEPWTQWANNHNFKSRLQAHGSPGNLIDLYASADIPECETFGSMPYDIPGLRREMEDIREGDADPVMLKFSSSAAHISGKPLTSSETFTWLRDHFKVALSQCKPEVEDLFLNGVNHVFLHGTTYSPERAEWPGWKFYASVNFNPNLSIGEDENQLFSYIANCQSLLQEGQPDNETLLYWSIYDVWNTYLNGSLFFQFKIHSLEEWLHHEPFYDTTKGLMQKGYGVDFISDNFIAKATVKDSTIQLPGGNYKALVIPTCKYMPLKTLEKLIALKKQGANIIFQDVPESVPGFNNYEKENNKLKQLLENNSAIAQPSKDIYSDLGDANIYPETLVETGLKYIRRDSNGNKIYYLVNHTSKAINQFIPINSDAEYALILDPKTNAYGKAEVKIENKKTLVKVNIKPGDALFLKTAESTSVAEWNYSESTNKTYDIEGVWQISFLRGGPELPDAAVMPELVSWTTLGEKAENFSGTAKYEIEFENPDASVKNWGLTLGDVRESAKVWINGNYVGTLWANPFEINIGPLVEGKNTMILEVTNLSANRIRAKELRGEEWKNFYEINMVNKDYQKFDATKWSPMPSGILGPVKLTALN
ncbi:glycosyl hydrolase [Flavobacteriaceae bacterium SZ-1-7]|uniref:glycosyl hydrolase n=1 Tax=Tamlana sedimenti TaxID=3134126 RepID=UPI003129B8CC